MTPTTLEELKAVALFSCEQPHCEENVSYHADMLVMLKGKRICEECFADRPEFHEAPWSTLPPFEPFAFIDEALKALAGEVVNHKGHTNGLYHVFRHLADQKWSRLGMVDEHIQADVDTIVNLIRDAQQ